MLDSPPSSRHRGLPVRSALIIDDDSTSNALARSLRRLDLEVWLETDLQVALEKVPALCPDLLVTELRLGPAWAFDLLTSVRTYRSDIQLAVVTAYPSVATAVRAIRLGANAYLPKPTDAETLLTALNQEVEEEPPREEASEDWPTLDRTIWEHLNQVYMAEGSLSAAARRLGIDRRSLRRMMQKFPPPR
jgi:two-component system response regulator RegA